MAKASLRLVPVLTEYGSPDGTYDDWFFPVFSDSHTLLLGPGEKVLSTWYGPILPPPNGGWGNARTAREGRTFLSKWTLSSRSLMTVTNERIVISSIDIAKGSSYFATGILAPVALVATGVSAARGRARAHGRIATFQVRYEWLSGARAKREVRRRYESNKVTLFVRQENVEELECVEFGVPDNADLWFPWFVDNVQKYRDHRYRSVLGADHRCVEVGRHRYDRFCKEGGLFETGPGAVYGRHLLPAEPTDEATSTAEFRTRYGPPEGFRTVPLVETLP